MNVNLTTVAAVSLFVVSVGAQQPSWIEGSSTVAVLPDTERYSDDYPQHFHAQTAWIEQVRELRRVELVVHLGDVTQHNAAPEWAVAKAAFGRIDPEVPVVLAAGNHDYPDNSPRDRAGSLLTATFPADRRLLEKGEVGLFEAGRVENSYRLLRLAERDWIVLSLEMGPRDEVVGWGNDVLAAHPDRLAMIVTHAYLFRNNQRYDHRRGRERASPHGWGNDGEELWRKLVRKHANVRIVLSAHVSSGGLGYLRSEGDYGNGVHQLMVDYEKMKQGGLGFLRLLEFLPDGKTVQVRTWSPVLNEARRSELEEFRFELTGPTRTEPLPPPELRRAKLQRAPARRWTFDGPRGLRDLMGHGAAELRLGSGVAEQTRDGDVELAGDGFLALPDGLLGSGEEFSFEVWVTPGLDQYRWNSVVRFGDADHWLTYTFRTRDVHRAEIAVNRHNEDVQREVGARAGQRMHLCAVYARDAETGRARLELFRDGESFGAIETGLMLRDVPDVGHRLGPFAGRFHELRLHHRALSAAEVRGSVAAGPDRVVVERR